MSLFGFSIFDFRLSIADGLIGLAILAAFIVCAAHFADVIRLASREGNDL